jgi:hypothetical protein
MKRVLLVSFGLIMLGSYAGCLPEETTPTGTGGSQGTAGTGAAGTQGTAGTGVAGTTGTGGNDSTGTAGSQGGDASGTAGNGTAGSGTAGNGTAGNGTAGNGTAGNGTAGTGTAGNGTAGSGGSGTAGTTGRGGTAGTGTAGTGTAGTTSRGGTGGTAGTGTAGAGGTLPTIPELFPTSGSVGSFDGRLLLMPCGDNNESGTDCGGGGAYYTTAGSTATPTRITCSGSALNVNQVFYVGGETGKMYNVTVHFYGIAEPKVYGNGITRDAGTGRPGGTTTTTGTGTLPTAWATAPGGHSYPASDYNTNEIRVCRTRACATADETNVYYLNADTSQGHWTYVLNYEKDIVVVGGGSIRVRNYDQNCREIKNCGPSGAPATDCATLANRRIIDVSAANPKPATTAAPMGGLLQPNLISERPAGSSGQWLLIDVVKINSVQ